ncbi:unnamed protein product, partial [marine sediment metagenome]
DKVTLGFGLANKIFAKILGKKNFELTISGGNTQLSGGDHVRSALGGFNIFSSNDLKPEDLQAFADGIVEFDNTLAQFMNEDQLARVTGLLDKWAVQFTGSGLTLEAFLESRLKQIEFVFGGKAGKPFMDFINAAEDFQERFQRVAISFATQALFEEDPSIFGEHTEAEFLAVVEAFQRGGEDIIDTFARVVDALVVITGLTKFLGEFASSDLASDFQALVDLQDMSLTQALGTMNEGLFDAITNFDGSIESLQEIGLI